MDMKNNEAMTECLREVKEPAAKRALILTVDLLESINQRLQVVEGLVQRHEDTLQSMKQQPVQKKKQPDGLSIG